MNLGKISFGIWTAVQVLSTPLEANGAERWLDDGQRAAIIFRTDGATEELISSWCVLFLNVLAASAECFDPSWNQHSTALSAFKRRLDWVITADQTFQTSDERLTLFVYFKEGAFFLLCAGQG